MPHSSTFDELLGEIQAHLQRIDFPRAFVAARAASQTAETAVQRVAAGYWLARCHYLVGEWHLAITLAYETRSAAAALGEAVWEAMCLALQARCLAGAGDFDGAREAALKAWKLVEPLGGHDEQARAARQAAAVALGVVHRLIGELAMAMEWVQRAVDEARQLADQSTYASSLDMQAIVLSSLASRAASGGDHAQSQLLVREAIALRMKAVEIARSCGNEEVVTTVSLNLAEALTVVGETNQALELLLDWGRRHPRATARHRVHQLDALGQVYLALARPEDAVQVLQEALTLGDAPIALQSLATEHLSAALERCGRWREALMHYKAFHQLHAKAGAERAQRNARVVAARLEIDRALAHARELEASNTELKRRADDLARQANEDALTGLPNRRYIERLLAVWPQPLALAMIDVDHFKQVNDRHSHAVGDQVLKQVAALLRAGCRPNDVAARFGGEEFVVLLDNRRGAKLAALRGAAERLRAAVEAHGWDAQVPGLRVTVSVGLALASEVEDAGQLMAKADARLYAAKHGGRNRVVDSG